MQVARLKLKQQCYVLAFVTPVKGTDTTTVAAEVASTRVGERPGSFSFEELHPFTNCITDN